MTTSKKPLQLGGREFRFAAFSFRQLDEHKADIDLLMSASGMNFANADAREAVMRVITASVSGAGDTIERDHLLDNLTFANFNDVVRQLFDRNGFIAKEGEQGEAQAAASST